MERPEYGNSIAEIPGTICRLMDAESNLERLEQVGEVEEVENVVLIFIDAFGFNQWKNFDSGLFRKAEENGELHKITSVFPSATPATLTSLNTGLQPVQHSLLGWEMYYEEIDSKILTLPFTDTEWTPLDEDPEILFEGETFYSDLEASGINTYALLDEEIAESEYSEMITGEAEVRPYMNIADMSNKLANLLKEEGRKYIYAYIDEVDKTCHENGPFSQAEQSQLNSISDNLERELGEVDDEVADETLILFSADHGQIKASEKIDLMKYDEVEKSLKTSREEPITPCGCARSVYLHVKEGKIKELKEFLENEIDAEIMRTEEAVKQGLFGNREVGEKFYSRAGELLVIPNGKKAIWYDDWEQTGYHGGLHEDEMYIPLCTTRLSNLS